jgi:16S rRNA processing protein RimM
MLKEECFFLGKLTKTHGIKGELLLRSEKELPDEFEKTETVFIEIDEQPVPFFVSPDGIHIRDSFSAIIKFDDIDSETVARDFVNTRLFIPVSLAEELFKNSASRLEDLLGFMVLGQKGQAVGEILEILNIALNPLLRVSYKGRDVLLPFHEDLLVKIDEKRKAITLKIPDGVLEL